MKFDCKGSWLLKASVIQNRFYCIETSSIKHVLLHMKNQNKAN